MTGRRLAVFGSVCALPLAAALAGCGARSNQAEPAPAAAAAPARPGPAAEDNVVNLADSAADASLQSVRVFNRIAELYLQLVRMILVPISPASGR